jgi:hypothetical protein
MRIGLKPSEWERDGADLIVVCDPSRSVQLDDPDGRVERLLASLRDHPGTVAQLRAALAADGLEVGADEVSGALWLERVAGYPLAGAYLTLFYLPVLWYVARYTGAGIGAGVASPRFWWGLLVGALVYVPVGVTLWIALAGLWRHRSGPVPVPADSSPA